MRTKWSVLFNLVGGCIFFFLNCLDSTALSVPLSLEIGSKSEHVTLGDDIIIDVKVINNTGKDYVVLFDQFYFGKNGQSFPVAKIRFYVDDGITVRELELIKADFENVSDDDVKPPEPNELYVLGINRFFGQRFILNKQYSPKLTKGKYAIRAVYENSSRSWLTQKIEEKKYSPDTITYKIDKVFDGTIESNTIVLQVD